MTTSLVGSLTATQTTPGATLPANAGLAGIRDPGGLLQSLAGSVDGFVGEAKALGLSDVITGLLAASDTWQTTPVDMTGSAHGLSAGFTAYVASVITDSPTVTLYVDVSQDGITFANVATVLVAQGTDSLYTATIDLPWRGFRWVRARGAVGSTAPTSLLAASAGPKAS